MERKGGEVGALLLRDGDGKSFERGNGEGKKDK